MATNVDTGLTASARRPQIFTMSDGNLVAVYYNGTAWGYRIKASGTWGARTALTSSPASQGARWAQDANNLFGAVSGSGVSFYVYKLAYSAGSITQTNTLTGDNVPVLAVYLDTTNARFDVVTQVTSAGIYLYSFATSNLATGIAGVQITAGSPPVTGQDDTTWAAAGNGTGTYSLAWFTTAGGTAFNVVQLVTTTTAITSQTAETSVPALAANATGLDAIYDGTNVVFVANQNNAALRYAVRTAANTYTGWTTIITETIAGVPSVARKGTGSGSDLLVVYRRNATQANGEVYKVQRLSATWDASGTSVAGGAATGWASPMVPRSDLNETSGTVRVAYITGTANPWTLVEDSTTIGTVTVSATVTAVPAVALGSVPVATVTGGTTGMVSGLPAVGLASVPAAGVGASAAVAAVSAAAQGSAPPANGIVSVFVGAPAVLGLGGVPVPFVSGGGAVTVSGVPAMALGSVPRAILSGGQVVTAIAATALGSAPVPALSSGSTVLGVPAVGVGQGTRGTLSPSPLGGGGVSGDVAATFAEASA